MLLYFMIITNFHESMPIVDQVSIDIFNNGKTSSSVQSLSHVQLFATPWTAACQASLAFIICWSLLKLKSIESAILHNHLILCRPFSSCPQSFPASGSFLMSWLFASGDWSIRALASASVPPMNIQDWFLSDLATAAAAAAAAAASDSVGFYLS